jgi:hypothetical protein
MSVVLVETFIGGEIGFGLKVIVAEGKDGLLVGVEIV